MTSDEINAGIGAIEDRDDTSISPIELVRNGKVVPYLGWYWRDVNFDGTFWLAAGDQWVGFCQSNKWGYPMFRVLPEQGGELRRLAVNLVEHKTQATAQALFDYMQSIKPPKSDPRWRE